MTDTVHLGLPTIEGAQAQKHVTHNEALVVLDALVMLAVIDRDLSSPPVSPGEGDRYLVNAPGAGAFAGKDDQVAHYIDGGWSFYEPELGWICYVGDEAKLVAWDGASWQVVNGETITELQNLVRLGVGTTADATNPFAAKLNNALWVAKTVGEGGDGDLRYKLSKESAAKTLSLLFQTAFSGRAEIGLTGDDDFHFKTSPDGSTWIDALLLDKTTGSTKVNAGFFLTGDLSPPQITSDQNDYSPTGLPTASVLRLSSDAAGRSITGLAGGADGRVLLVHNVGTQSIVIKDESGSSSAANRFALVADLTLTPDAVALLQYDATSARWRVLAPGPRRKITVYSAAGSGTHTTVSGCLNMLVTVVGGGGGGGGGSGNSTAGGNGGNGGQSSFGSYTANGGSGGQGGGQSGNFGNGGAGGAGGAAGSTGDFDISGAPGITSPPVSGFAGQGLQGGGQGAGTGGSYSTAGGAGAKGGGGGGGGSAPVGTCAGGAGGGQGATCRKLVTSPAGSYNYTVASGGAAGTGGTGGGGGGAGGVGGAGYIFVEEYY